MTGDSGNPSSRRRKAKANTAWRNRAAELRALVAALNEDCVAWYASATVVFPEDTAIGAMIRGCVRTTYRKGKGKVDVN